jgi:hemerythrin
MEKFPWKEEYSMGVEKIDRQHKHLFEIINKLVEQVGLSADTELVSETLMEMVNYAREHFADEEKLMKEYDYPEIELQNKQHSYFISTTAELIISFMDNKHITGDEIAEFLKIWLTNHILKSDMKYKEYFRQRIPAGSILNAY